MTMTWFVVAAAFIIGALVGSVVGWNAFRANLPDVLDDLSEHRVETLKREEELK